MSPRQLKLGAYFRGSGVHGDSWRHPAAHTDAYRNFERYKSYAQTLERACFHALFFYDNVFADSHPDTVASTPGTPRWDPLVLLAALATTTRRIGLIATASTSYSEPYNLARHFASLDHLSGGRVGWNVVTSTAGGENFGLDATNGQKNSSTSSRACGTAGLMMHSWKTRKAAAGPTLPSCTSSTTKESTFASKGRSTPLAPFRAGQG